MSHPVLSLRKLLLAGSQALFQYLLQQMRNPKPLSRNSLGKLIPQIFSATGKNVTLNIIRHVYVSEKVDLEAVKQFQEIAKSMMHDSTTQMDYNKGC